MSHLLSKSPFLDAQLNCLTSHNSVFISLVNHFITQPTFAGYFPSGQTKQLRAAQPDLAQLLRDLVPLAKTYSHAPISNFTVGAVALGASGSIYLGANIEFVGQTLGQTVHAEQCVITNAWHHNETHLTHLAVSAAPCGHCRQFINELSEAKSIDVLLPDQPSVRFSELLPLSFGPDNLGVDDRLMQSAVNKIELTHSDQLIASAISAAQRSYSPYSNSPSGVAIATSKAQYSGSYAENCAYNPSLSPLQGALINLRLAGDSFADIQRVVLVENPQANVLQHTINQQMLNALGDIDYQRITY